MKFSIVIPARNESAYIEECFNSIEKAAALYPGQVEVVVVINRCTDSTENIAVSRGARVVREDSKNLAKIRNAGVIAATGEILVTIDADSRMSPNMLQEIDRALESGKYIGGGVPIITERMSLGIFLTGLFILACIPRGISAGLFWCYRSIFNELGGFDEDYFIAEDVEFANRLKAYGKARKKRFGTLWKTRIVTSCRKFDRFGDWVLLKEPRAFVRALRGKDENGLADKVFYDFKR